MRDALILKVKDRAAEPSLASDNGARFGLGAAAPLAENLISRAEEALGFKLPPLLRDLYRLVGNGGFGPGYGILPLIGAPRSTDVESVVELYTAFRSADPEDPAWSWPAQLLPICDWGCAIRSCLAVSSEGGVLTFDPNVRDIDEPMENALALTHTSLDSWAARLGFRGEDLGLDVRAGSRERKDSD
jgi:hypothetical protein